MCLKQNIAAAILAGGKATRMGGIAKGNLVINDNRTIIQNLLLEIQKAAIKKTIIIANDPVIYSQTAATIGNDETTIEIIPDLIKDQGPLAGILSALNYYKNNNRLYNCLDGVLILPCDMPNFTAKEIHSLIKAYHQSFAPVVFAATKENEWHPLCAIVSIDALDEIQNALKNNQQKVSEIWQKLNAEMVMFQEKDSQEKFKNINEKWQFRGQRAEGRRQMTEDRRQRTVKLRSKKLSSEFDWVEKPLTRLPPRSNHIVPY